jgi:uncharacterized membrane protein YccC
MLKHTTKQAIKTGLALSLSLLTVHWLGWQKSSWVMLTVFVLSLTDSYGYSALKSQNRAMGTLLGAVTAFIILGLFSQQRMAFLASIVAFLMFCVFMNFDKRRGYLYNIAITVCLVISSAGIDSGAAGLSTAILRFQDTVLGVVIFSLVYRLVWPTTSESEFHRLAVATLDSLEQELNGETPLVSPEERKKHILLISDILTLPEIDKTVLAERKAQLKCLVNGLVYVNRKLAAENNQVSRQQDLTGLITEMRALLSGSSNTTQALMSIPVQTMNTRENDLRTKQLKGVLIALGLSLSIIAMWILMPVPGGSLFPVFGLIVAANMASAPAKAALSSLLIYITFASIVLLQYVFLFPVLTASWQLALVFFVNIVVGYSLLDKWHLTSVRVLLGNALINMVGSATELVPSYNIISPVTMLVFLFMVMAVFQFNALLFERVSWPRKATA